MAATVTGCIAGSPKPRGFGDFLFLFGRSKRKKIGPNVKLVSVLQDIFDISERREPGVTSFGYDLANRLWSMGSTTYANDAFGARTGKVGGDSWTYSYDGESRLTRVAKNGATQVDCVYDGNGMRVKKVEGGKTTYYVYSGANPLLEYSPTDGSFLYRIYAGKKAVAEEKAGVVKFYHKDHLGSTRVVTNAAGVKIAEYKFAPYGEKEVASGDGTEYGFTDKAEDVSTGLKYFGARFYDPEIGRFISQDPKRQGGNWYSYCFNNPVNATDPDGQWADTLRDAVSLAADVKDIIDNPQDPVAWACLAADVACIATPGLTGGRTAVQAIDKAIDAGKAAKNAEKVVEASKNAGKYSHISDPKNVGPGKSFTKSTKSTILEENRRANGGVLKSDKSGKPLVPAEQSKKGVTPSKNEAHVDHVNPKSNGGTNSPSNAQVLSREENLSKSDSLDDISEP
jgi:RHS repeat-associated protein